MIPPNELTISDYLILEYINKFTVVSKSQILMHFSNKIAEVEMRLSSMTLPDYGDNHSRCYVVEKCNISFDDYGIPAFESKNSYHISALGRKILHDYLTNKKSANRKLWLTNAWIPIIVAFVTTLLTNYIVPKLPLIIKWFSDVLSKNQS